MGFFDKFLDAVRIEDDDYEDDEDFYDEDEDDFDDYDDEPEKPKKRFFSKMNTSRKVEDDFDDDDLYDDLEPKAAPKTAAKQVSAKPAASAAASSSKVTPMRKTRGVGSMEVCVIKPTKVEDFREIADTLLSSCTVVLNLEGLDVELAQRIIDFSSGSCYAIGGGLQKGSSYIFILTPASVEISGDIQDLLGGAIPSMRTSF